MYKIKFLEFLSARGLDKIDSIYTGHESGCRCGCRGKYFEPGTVGFNRALNKISKLNPEITVFSISPKFENAEDSKAWGEWSRKNCASTEDCEPGVCYAHVDHNDCAWVDFVSGYDRTITVYFNGLEHNW